MFLLTGLKVSSLAFICVFYRPEHNAKGERDPMKLNFKVLEMQKLSIPMDRAQSQTADEKNGVIYLVIMFTPQVMAIKMSKMAGFLYFLLIPAKNPSQFG